MKNILIDNIDKRMTAPLVEYLVKKGYNVEGIKFKNTKVISNHINSVFEISKENIKEDLIKVLSKFSSEDYLLVGHPLVIEAVNEIRPNIKYIVPTNELIKKITNKKWLMDFANNLNIKVPKNTTNKYPLVVKLNNSENTTLKPQQRYKIVNNEEEYRKAIETISNNKDNILVQEYVTGKGFGVSMLLDFNSNLVDYIMHERILEYPISGGPSAICISQYKKDLVYSAYKLLKELKWTGYAMVEFKGDYLIEINPRYWGSMPLLFVAKSDFFENYLKVLDNSHKNIDENDIPYKLKKKMYYFPQAYFAVIAYLKRGNIKKALKHIANIITAKEGIFYFKNPVPFINYLKSLVRRNIK
ncbi:ATP-grasp domain-containing protein [Defluviitalea phaphyphila]|uniref:ATP-grasp domain-containing protein n=1 Tax=Defluviitalea phaphyphila TaxID=1473580 RepID=UPI000730DAF4|nr:ATP-grasp domain-containing protein [Defluviitalea phaphyphila]